MNEIKSLEESNSKAKDNRERAPYTGKENEETRRIWCEGARRAEDGGEQGSLEYIAPVTPTRGKTKTVKNRYEERTRQVERTERRTDQVNETGRIRTPEPMPEAAMDWETRQRRKYKKCILVRGFRIAGIMKRARINTLKKRLCLMDSLVKAGALHGIEIWGWKRRPEIEKVQGKFVKMALGLARNTPDYAWKLEAGRRSIEVEARRRAGTYITEIMEMGDERWPKICLREEVRGILNNNGSIWRNEVRNAMSEVEDGRVINWIWNKGNSSKILESWLNGGVQRKAEQDTQKDWIAAGASSSAKSYCEIKIRSGMAEYWEIKEISGADKEQWARLRCGNVGRGARKGIENGSAGFVEEQKRAQNTSGSGKLQGRKSVGN